jgi:hypothetical protein
MRTTVTLDEDVVRIIRRIMREEEKSFKQALNDALRRAARPARGGRKRRFRVRPHDSPFVGGIDVGRLNQLADQLDADAAFARLTHRRGG